MIKKATADLSLANKRLKELDKAKSEFLSITSHQLRTPLAGLRGYLSMILDGDFGVINSDLRLTIENLFNGTSRLIRLVNTFLNASRIEMGKLDLDLSLTQITDLIDNVLKYFNPEAQKKGLEIRFIKPAVKLPKIKIDADKIEDVLVNLIDNALKYTSNGWIEVQAGIEKNSLVVSIKDSGVGFNNKDSRHFFHKFTRGNKPKLGIGGSGLGLFIVKKITEAHGGKVTCHSDGMDKGATFKFYLPIKK